MNALDPILSQLKLHTQLFNNVLWDVEEQHARFRIHVLANDLRWIAGHLVSMRSQLALGFGLPAYFKATPLFLNTSANPSVTISYDPSIAYPRLQDMIVAWNGIWPTLMAVLEQLPERQFSMPLQFESPIGGSTLIDRLAFMASHESYHIGQMSLIRGSLGLPGVIYSNGG